MIDNILSPHLVRPGEAAVYDHLQGEKIHVLIFEQETGGNFALFVDELPPKAGPPLHTHQHEDETIFVLDGELVIQIDEERFVVPAGCAVFLPRGVPHTFTNPGPRTARALVALTPGRLERFFAEVEPLLIQAEPDMASVLAMAARYGIEAVGPPLAGRPNGRLIADGDGRALRPETATTLRFPGGDTIRMILKGEQTEGRIAMLVGEFPPGSGSSLHQHRHEDEVIYVLDGALTVQTGWETVTAAAGAAAFLPRGVPHAFRNESEQSVMAVAIITPAGFENYFTESLALVTEGAVDEETMAAMAARYGLESST